MNSLFYQAGLLLGSIVLMSISSYVLTNGLEKIGTTFRLSEGMLGILTALGANAPEMSSSITALAAGHHDLGIGVVLGSNVFNLAALLGLSAVIAGAVRVTNAGALFNGGVALFATLIAALLLLGLIAPPFAIVFLVLLVAPYVYIIALTRTGIEQLPLPHSITNFLARTVRNVRKDARKNEQSGASLVDWLTLGPALFGIIAGSRGTVKTTVDLAGRFSISHAVAGTLVIAALTGIPNAVAAINLAKSNRGGAVETECFNSNTLNLILGLSLPALITGVGFPSVRMFFALGWLVVMTIASVILLRSRNGLGRGGGFVLITLYAIFAAAIFFWPNR